MSERKRLLRNTLLWSTLSPFHLPRKEKSLVRPQWQIATRASVCVCVCVCVKSSVHFLQISVPPWCRKTTHYRKVGALYFLIHLEDTFINFAKRYHLIFQIHIQFYYLSVFCLLVCITFFATCLFLYVLIRFKLTVCRYVVNKFSFCS